MRTLATTLFRSLCLVSSSLAMSLVLAGCVKEAPSSGPGGGAVGSTPANPASSKTGEGSTASTPAAKTSSTPPSGAASSTPAASKKKAAPAPAGKEYVVLTTRDGEIIIELFDKDAPRHCANFRRLVKAGFYNGNTFHRVVENVLVQAGDPDPAGAGGGSAGDPIPPEIKLPHRRGAVAMARPRDEVNPNRNSFGSQFYICLNDAPELDSRGYTVFGQVVKGLAVARKIAPPGDPSKNFIVPPAQRVKIIRAEVKRLDLDPSELDAATLKDARPTTAATAAANAAANGDTYAVLETDVPVGDGKIVIDLFEEAAPRHAANFKKLVRQGFYNGLIFHRVIEGFVAQGGDPEGTGRGGPGYTIPAEIGLPHRRGSVAAARLGDAANPKRESSGSQFYICFKPLPNLDRGGYTVFGHVVKGMNVVDRIPRGQPPRKPAKILKAYLVPASSIKVDTPSPAR